MYSPPLLLLAQLIAEDVDLLSSKQSRILSSASCQRVSDRQARRQSAVMDRAPEQITPHCPSNASSFIDVIRDHNCLLANTGLLVRFSAFSATIWSSNVQTLCRPSGMFEAVGDIFGSPSPDHAPT